MENLRTQGPKPADDTRLAAAWDQFYAHCFAIINQCPGVRKLAAHDRDDCVQDVMMEIVRKFGAPRTEQDREEVTRWVRALSRNKAADIVRRRYRKPETLFEDGSGDAVPEARRDPDGEAAGGEYVSLVWEALLSLDAQVPVKSYLIFYLRTLEEWDIPEIAELFQISPEQARARCHRVRKKFGSIIKTRGGPRPIT